MSALQELRVDLGERSYPIWIGPDLLKQLAAFLNKLNISSSQKLFLVTDEHVGQIYAKAVLEHLNEAGFSVFQFVIPAGEESKSLAQYEEIMTYAIQQRLDRKSVILALGGGVVGDLAGFVASTFMRGIPFIQLPTTVLAHDSSVGGKVAVNHPLGKNLIGSFYQPLAVIYDTKTLRTLPKREISSGFAEVLKLAFIRDSDFMAWLDDHRVACTSLAEPYLSQALSKACQIKADIVGQDEKEHGVRAILNLGHTFGHALESLGQYERFTHGEAVAIGMVLAARVSEYVFGLEQLEQQMAGLLAAYGLPTNFDVEWTPEQILDKMYLDKKVVSGALNLILLKRIGQAVIVNDVSPELIKKALTRM